MKKFIYLTLLVTNALYSELSFLPSGTQVTLDRLSWGPSIQTTSNELVVPALTFPKFFSKPDQNPMLTGLLIRATDSLNMFPTGVIIPAAIYKFDLSTLGWSNDYPDYIFPSGLYTSQAYPPTISFIKPFPVDEVTSAVTNFDGAMNTEGKYMGAVYFTRFDQIALSGTYLILAPTSFLDYPDDMFIPTGTLGANVVSLEAANGAALQGPNTYALPQIAADDAGNAAVIWKEVNFTGDTSIPDMKGAVFDGSTWSKTDPTPATILGAGYSGDNTDQQLIHQIAAGGDIADEGQIVGVWWNETAGKFQSQSVLSDGSDWNGSTIDIAVSSTLFVPFVAQVQNQPSNILAVGVDGSGVAHCLYTKIDGGSTTIEAARKPHNVNSWEQLGTLSGSGIARHPRIAVRSDGTAMAVWDEGPSGLEQIMAKIYENGAWQAQTFTVSTTSGVGYPQVAVDNSSNKAVVSWCSNDTTERPARASLFDGTSFSFEQQISFDGGTDLNTDIRLTTVDYSGSIPKVVYQTIGELSSTIGDKRFINLSSSIAAEGGPVEPPSGLQGFKRKDRFALQIDHINRITWKASPSTNVDSYAIYRNGTFIGCSSSSQLFFDDHNRRPGVVYTYSVVARSADNVSTAVTIQI